MSLFSAIGRLFHPHRHYQAPAPAPTPAPAEPVPAPVRQHQGQSDYVEGTPMKVTLGEVTGFSPAERAKLDQAAQLLGDVLNSQEFRDAVLNYAHGGQSGFVQSNGLSNAEVYQAIQAAKEGFTSEADHEVDLNMSIRNFSWFQRHVVGYTTPDSPTITVNRSFFAGYTPAEIAGNMAHEWMHKLGFDHDFNATAQRPYSVPYAIGDLVEKLARERSA